MNTKVTKEQVENIQIDHGILYKNYGLESAPIVNITGNCLCSIIGSVNLTAR